MIESIVHCCVFFIDFLANILQPSLNEIWMRLTVAMILSLYGLFAQISITKHHKAEAQLRQFAAELKPSNRELRQFAHAVSHDLQDPARMVLSYTRLLADRYQQQLDADTDSYINHAVEGVTRMRELISGLLACSKIETQAQDFKPMNCEEVLESTLPNLQVTIKEAQARVIHDPLPTVTADGTQTGQLFQNLIGNAIKFRRRRRLVYMSPPVKMKIIGSSRSGTTA